MTQIKATLPTAEDDFGKRWCDMLEAVRLGILSESDMNSVLSTVVEKQWKDGDLRTDRYVLPKEKDQHLSAANWKGREDALMMNASDDKILAQKKEYADEVGMDMTDEGYAWFLYVTEGGNRPGVPLDEYKREYERK